MSEAQRGLSLRTLGRKYVKPLWILVCLSALVMKKNERSATWFIT